jgi:hypothetical protein
MPSIGLTMYQMGARPRAGVLQHTVGAGSQERMHKWPRDRLDGRLVSSDTEGIERSGYAQPPMLSPQGTVHIPVLSMYL